MINLLRKIFHIYKIPNKSLWHMSHLELLEVINGPYHPKIKDAAKVTIDINTYWDPNNYPEVNYE